MKRRNQSLLFPFVILACQGTAAAEDIDLFVQGGASPSDRPNVLFVIDNAANFESNATGYSQCTVRTPLPSGALPPASWALNGTVGGIEQCALYNLIDSLPDGALNVGFMAYNDGGIRDHLGLRCRGATSGTRTGGCLLYPMVTMTRANKDLMLAWITQWKTTGASTVGSIKANSAQTGATLQEAWAYYKGRVGLSEADYADLMPPANGCADDYIIYIGNSYSQSGSSNDQTGNKGPKNVLVGASPVAIERMRASPAATLAQQAEITPTISSSCGAATLGNPHESKGFYADEWTRYAKANGINTYTIGVLGPNCNAEYAALMTSMAAVGGGKYFPTTNYAGLVLALGSVISEIQAVNSVFASVSLPISINTQGTYLNQVYVGMFRPDANARPRWEGNLKQYRLARDDTGTNLRLADAREPLPQSVIASNGGFVTPCALSYWTPPLLSPDDYWKNIPPESANCSGYAASSNTPDGNLVEKGAQGFLLRGLATATSVSRTVRTCVTCADNTVLNTTATTLATGNAAITGAALGNALMSGTDRDNLIDWARGVNNNAGNEPVAVGTGLPLASATAMRPSVHGDVLHSRPVAVNFGADDADKKVVVFYGGNDGVLRAINANRTQAIGAAGAGQEIWAFMAPEFYPRIKRLRDNVPKISLTGLAPVLGETREPKPYGIDGPLAVYQSSDRATTWLYATMRRGGRAVYAFDVSSIAGSTLGQATLKWRRGCNGSTCSTGFEEIGQTWSAPQIVRTTSSANPLVLLMGGGYDECEDADPYACLAPTKGHRIYVMNADTGTLIKAFQTSRPVVGDVFVVPDFNTGLPKYAYAVDAGGKVYRISGATSSQTMSAALPANWTMTQIADLGCGSTLATSCKRKFLFAPDVVEKDGVYHLLLGSGDREKPLKQFVEAAQVNNYFFMIKDAPLISTWFDDEVSNCGSPIICPNSLVQIAQGAGDPDATDLAARKGWYLGMRAEEQVVTSAITVFGTTTFSTHTPQQPDPNACGSGLGTARVYNVAFLNAGPVGNANNRDQAVEGGGLPPSPVAGRVILDGETTPTPFLIGGSGTSALEASLPGTSAPLTTPKGWTYWYIAN